jgi:formate hydrogenlyase subunit 3/multisubunit Na+/H+ antiporter MnhD subunit
MLWGMGFIAAGSIILGIAPQLAVNYLLNPILNALQMSAVNVTWLGLSSDAGSFSSIGGLVLAVVSLVLGGVIYAIAYVSRQPKIEGAAIAGGGIFTGGEPLSSEGRLTAGDFSSIFLQNWHEFFRWTNVDAVYLGVWHGLQAVSRGLGAVVSWMERYALALVVVLSGLLLIVAKLFRPGEINWRAYASKWEFDVPVVIPNQVPTLLVFTCILAAVALILAALSRKSMHRLIPLMTLAAAFTIAGLFIPIFPYRLLHLCLLELGAFTTIALVWQCARSTTAKYTYLAVVVLSALSASSELFTSDGFWIWAFLLTGICIKLAAVPLLFWLLALADEIPALVLGLIIAVVDMAAFGAFYINTWCLTDNFSFANGDSAVIRSVILLSVAAATSFLAALLMFTQKSLKRLLVLSTIEDVGFLLLGVFSLKTLGYEGAMIAAATHSLAKALLFICLAGPEADGALEGEPKGLAARYPVAAFGFLFGMLAMLGIPPTMGFLGRWRLYETAVQIGWPLAAVFILSSIFALIAYVLALTRCWWGPPDKPDPSSTPEHPIMEPFILQSVIIALVVLILAAGIWPDALQMLFGGRL